MNGAPGTAFALSVVPAAAVGYPVLAARARRKNPVAGWSSRRTACHLAGCAMLAVALLPPVASLAHHDFRGHMLQHLLIGMYAPLAFVLAAPVTLLLRTLPAARARRLARLLRSRPLRRLAHPAVALLLSVGPLGVLYFTPLYGAVLTSEPAHWLLHVHFLLAGCLFAWVIAGPDPAPHRPGVPVRLWVLGIAVAGHAVLSQLMYGGFGVAVPAPAAQIRGGAELMYYGGDIAELLLAGALVAGRRPVRSTAPAGRGLRRSPERRTLA